MAHGVDDQRSTDLEARVGDSVRELRTARGWSQDQLAKQLTAAGLQATQSTVARIEGARRPLRLNEAATLAKVLDVELTSLYSKRRQAVTEEQLPQLLKELWQAEEATRELDDDVERAREWLYAAETKVVAVVSDAALMRRTRDELRQLIEAAPNGAQALAQHYEDWNESEYERLRDERLERELMSRRAESDA